MSKKHICQICNNEKEDHEVIHARSLPSSLKKYIKKKHEQWSDDSVICFDDLNKYRNKYLNNLIKKEQQEIETLDKTLEFEISQKELLSKNMDIEFDKNRTVSDKIADSVASFGGSWKFIVAYIIFLILWISLNLIILTNQTAFDPYPFVFLNLVLAVLTTLEAPIIMMSQNRQNMKDSRKAEHNYLLDLKQELELNSLHDKIDHLIMHQCEHFIQNQDLLSEVLEQIKNKQ